MNRLAPLPILLAALVACASPPPAAPRLADGPREIDDPRIRPILERSCSGCHANERHDAWYGRLVPSSWSSRGREALNFSDWDSYDGERRRAEIGLIAAVVADGSMPLVDYAFVNRRARLADHEKRLVAEWAREVAPLAAH